MIRSFLEDPNDRIHSQLIESIQWDIYAAFQKAYDAKKRDSILSIITFVNRTRNEAISKSATEILQQLHFMPVHFFKISENNNEFRNIVLEQQSIALKTNWLVLKYKHEKLIQTENSKTAKAVVEKFYLGVISFFHVITESLSSDELQKAYSEFNQMSGERYTHQLNSPRSEFLRKQRNIGINPTILQEYKINLEKQFFLQYTHRRVALSIKSWFIYLYSMDRIKLDKLQFIYQKINQNYFVFENLIDDMNYIIDYGESGTFGLNNWDFTEREAGKTYSPPSIRHWILHGVLAHLLRPNSIQFDIDMITYRPDLFLLFEDAVKLLKNYKENIEKWKDFFGIHFAPDTKDVIDQRVVTTKLLELFDERARPVQNFFEQLKIMRDNYETQIVKSQQLDETLVTKFKQSLAEAWKEQCHSFNLFEQFEAIDVKEDPAGLTYLGQSTLLERMKVMFVENGHQEIVGITDIGAGVGRATDYTFIDTILENKKESTEFNSTNSSIDNALNILTESGYSPNLIIIPPELSYRGDLLKSKDYVPQWQESSNHEGINRMGNYKGIPIISFYTTNLTNQIICCQFEKAFRLELFEASHLFYKRLNINVRELTVEEIKDKFEKAPDYWRTDSNGLKFSDSQALSRVATSILLEIWSRGKFIIKDNNAIAISLIKEI
ncbi:hypothetical protein SanaruYs_35000 [Chryseotalea sanaruensis]|uniref:Uncharacterized protein n=1 Tax=Chryseotalea sanaruensis TaxID=2482724 RepID=A0A401UEG6_9BACT|nr:hypothetical protein [Chryseotalea sanaruensis]GCC53257.1 hypothetical protein SanaruYs_35000 [Chryseotalea sanaruensis]